MFIYLFTWIKRMNGKYLFLIFLVLVIFGVVVNANNLSAEETNIAVSDELELPKFAEGDDDDDAVDEDELRLQCEESKRINSEGRVPVQDRRLVVKDAPGGLEGDTVLQEFLDGLHGDDAPTMTPGKFHGTMEGARKECDLLEQEANELAMAEALEICLQDALSKLNELNVVCTEPYCDLYYLPVSACSFESSSVKGEIPGIEQNKNGENVLKGRSYELDGGYDSEGRLMPSPTSKVDYYCIISGEVIFSGSYKAQCLVQPPDTPSGLSY
jgi:hypothetical protein